MRYLQKKIYSTCFFLYKRIMKLMHSEINDIWYRNSFSFDYWKFLHSDIDITIITTHHNKKLFKNIGKTHSLFRRFVRIIGEIEFFSEDLQVEILKCVNPFELTRDPILVLRYSLNKEIDVFDKIIFLHKFIVANWSKQNLNRIRHGKLEFFGKHLGLENHKTFFNFVDELANFLNMDSNEFKLSYQQELENLKGERMPMVSNLIYSLFYNKLCYLAPNIPLNEFEKNILKKNLLWELWGCYSYQALAKTDEMSQHINRLIAQLDVLVDSEFQVEMINTARTLDLIQF